MIDVLNKTVDDKNSWVETVLLGLIAFLVPTFLAKILGLIFDSGSVISNNSQIIVGSIVNAALVISALTIKGGKKIIGIVTMPSISTILTGYVFKSASVYMAYMIPAIWLGNFALIYALKYFYINKDYNYFISGLIALIIKVLIIYSGFMIINAFGIFPSKVALNLKTAMSFTQAITCGIGISLGYIINALWLKNK